MAAALPGRVAVADLEGLEREVADHRRGDPGASELAGDLAGHELDRLDGLEARFEAFERRDAVRVGGLDDELGGLHEAALWSRKRSRPSSVASSDSDAGVAACQLFW